MTATWRRQHFTHIGRAVTVAISPRTIGVAPGDLGRPQARRVSKYGWIARIRDDNVDPTSETNRSKAFVNGNKTHFNTNLRIRRSNRGMYDSTIRGSKPEMFDLLMSSSRRTLCKITIAAIKHWSVGAVRYNTIQPNYSSIKTRKVYVNNGLAESKKPLRGSFFSHQPGTWNLELARSPCGTIRKPQWFHSTE